MGMEVFRFSTFIVKSFYPIVVKCEGKQLRSFRGPVNLI